MEDR
ncbi:2341137e-52c6-4551-a073-70183cbef7e5 [Thermothielavioides terrestris]|jgi:hypothetical protein